MYSCGSQLCFLVATKECCSAVSLATWKAAPSKHYLTIGNVVKCVGKTTCTHCSRCVWGRQRALTVVGVCVWGGGTWSIRDGECVPTMIMYDPLYSST